MGRTRVEIGFRREQAFVFVLLLAAVLLLQVIGGAYSAALSGTEDEAAHYVTGLLFRDYVASGLRTTPIEYAEDYYLHYPKVGIGHWPPVFYALQAVWTLPFGASRTSVLLLMAVIAAALAWSLYRFLRDAGLPG